MIVPEDGYNRHAIGSRYRQICSRLLLQYSCMTGHMTLSLTDVDLSVSHRLLYPEMWGQRPTKKKTWYGSSRFILEASRSSVEMKLTQKRLHPIQISSQWCCIFSDVRSRLRTVHREQLRNFLYVQNRQMAYIKAIDGSILIISQVLRRSWRLAGPIEPHAFPSASFVDFTWSHINLTRLD